MAIELKQSLKLTQQLLITPQLQQAIKLLQLSRMELVETVQRELMENPVLEEGISPENIEVENTVATERMSDLNTATEGGVEAGQDALTPQTDAQGGEPKDFDWGSYLENNFRPSREYKSQVGGSDELTNYENMVTRPSSLQDHLEWQVHLSKLEPHEEEVCLEVIGNLDENGYLQSSLEEMAEKTTFSHDELEDALFVVQNLDPPGIGARDIKECLRLQVKNYPDRRTLEDIIDNHLSFLEKRDFPSLSKKIGVSLKKATDLAHIIYSLEPKPGRPFSSQQPQYVTPDVYVQKVGDEYVVVLNEDGLPRLQISNFYKNAILKEVAGKNGDAAPVTKEGAQAQDYIQDKLKSALWLIRSIHQRQKTLYKVTKALVKFQKDFFDNGVQCLKPLVLRDVADEIGVHESTVSRATNNKFVHSPQGIFELKYFFNTGLGNATGGQEFANEAVKQLVKKFIAQENNKNPLSDQEIAEMLQGHSINIARRTVAKYREMLGILPSSKRRQIG